MTEGLFETATDKEAMERAVAAAAPTVVERADLTLVHTLPDSQRFHLGAFTTCISSISPASVGSGSANALKSGMCLAMISFASDK